MNLSSFPVIRERMNEILLADSAMRLKVQPVIAKEASKGNFEAISTGSLTRRNGRGLPRSLLTPRNNAQIRHSEVYFREHLRRNLHGHMLYKRQKEIASLALAMIPQQLLTMHTE